jgi:hypothetical protein
MAKQMYVSSDMVASRHTGEEFEATPALPLVFPEEWQPYEGELGADDSAEDAGEESHEQVDEDDEEPDTVRISPPN